MLTIHSKLIHSKVIHSEVIHLTLIRIQTFMVDQKYIKFMTINGFSLKRPKTSTNNQRFYKPSCYSPKTLLA